MERVSNKISTALIIAALLIGSSLIMMSDKGPLLFGLPFLGVIGFLISMILGVGMVLSILKHREIWKQFKNLFILLFKKKYLLKLNNCKIE